MFIMRENRFKFRLDTVHRFIAPFCLLLVFLVCWTQRPAAACGYHNPRDLAVAGLNWIYPESLHVRGAIWAAQQDGSLPPLDKERITAWGERRQELEAMAYQKTVSIIRALGRAMKERTPEDRVENFSLVLAETALWSQFTVTSRHDLVAIDVGSAADDDLVIVTDEAALYAIGAGSLSLSDAVASGMMKLYGREEQENSFLKLFGSIGGSPL